MRGMLRATVHNQVAADPFQPSDTPCRSGRLRA